MDVHITLTGRGELVAQIYRQLLDAIVDGRLRPGDRLPPTRLLGGRLGVARNTVASAYERLTAEGFVTGRVGAGTFVCAEPVTQPRARTAPASAVRPRPVWRSLEQLPPSASTAAYDFRVGVPDGRLFPLETWRRLVARELRPAATRSARYGDPAGHPGLRAAIARYIGIARSVRTGPDDVLVTQGAQQALDLIGRVLIEPGDRVVVEEPGYPPARRVFASLGAHVVGVPVDDEGLDVSALPATARLVYTTPSHQFPLGTTMSLARRMALLAWARRCGAVVIEDDYDSEFRFTDRPLEPLQSLDRTGHVIYVGTFSKTLLPMLRVGFLVAPTSLQPALRSARHLADWYGEPITQGALARFLDEGLLARHIRRATREYAGRRELILAAALGDLGDLVRPVPSTAGLHVCVRPVPDATVDIDRAVRHADRAGVAVRSLGSFGDARPAASGLVIGYGAIDPDRIPEGMRRLGDTLRR